ncbi:hypothetical protein [Clostridium fallax]|uniref:Uncharacterized protein n=1 Tax=Clostridium fallax TaxID=1533 RepID=A0A1M4VVP8_9CLOT|nr:hypothetical protein [Clostridium fallax]SHE72990.1 hypothetical protein SAMN05443638_10944 [Clostridium fallax]SQB07716.1 Uncharacterised protein [Clostridium fallax]
MSLFLGKIHYWLFNKIKFYEEIESKIVEYGKINKILDEEFIKKVYEKYGEPIGDKPLEDIIDESNIHGWLQDKINSLEGRQAAFVTKILEINKESLYDLKNIFKEKGLEAGKVHKNGKDILKAMEIYNSINDYIIEGMPCDRINNILENSDELLVFKAIKCIHKDFWDEENGDVENFYILRDSLIKNFVQTLNNKAIYEAKENGERLIRIM